MPPKQLILGEIDSVKVLAWKSGSMKFWTNLMSAWNVSVSENTIF